MSESNPGDEVPPGSPSSGEDVCSVCHRTGRVADGECAECGATGFVTRAIGGG